MKCIDKIYFWGEKTTGEVAALITGKAA